MKEREIASESFHLPIHSLATARAGKELGTRCRFPMWMARNQVLKPLSVVSQIMCQQKAG